MSLLNELRRRWWLIVLALLVAVVALAQRVATFYTDVLWFDSIGFSQVFWTLLGTRIGLGAAAGLLFAALLAGNLLLAQRLAPPYRIPSPQEEGIERYREALEPFARPLLLGVAVILGILSGLSVAGEWDTYLLWANATEFGRPDPQFGLDVGFFVFVLPFHVLVNSWLFTSLAFTIVLTTVAHYLFGGIRPQAPGQKIAPQVYVHVSVLLAALVAVRAWGFWLDRYMLSYSQRGTVTGLSYTDVNAQLIAFQLLAVIAVVCVALFLVNIYFRNFLLPVSGVAILLIAALVLAGVYPAVIQRLRVAPQELPREEQYIARNLDMTRFAYGLRIGEDVEFEAFPARDELTPDQVADNARTLQSIRLWDPATLQNTYQQLQEFRTYYDFRDVDVDRYVFDDEDGLQQTMISVREISTDDLSADARTWQNERLVYTHGFGIVATNVSVASNQGQPVFFANNIPPQGVEKLQIENPRIYFGENPPNYSVVNSEQMELDYPVEGESPRMYEYTGPDGVDVGSPLRRLAFALREAEVNFVLSDLITSESRILFNRNIRDRVQSVAPFLKLDHDPYPVAVDDRIKWVLDTYTTTDMVPYSERIDLAEHTLAEQRQLVLQPDEDGEPVLREVVRQAPGLEGTANYIRNSVKAVVDAYTGEVTLYVIEEDDPVVQAWQNVFPDSFTPASEASEALQRHFRYPEDMFRVQSSMFETYHIEEAAEFYTREDAWDTPIDAAFSMNQQAMPQGQRQGTRAMRPYYLLMRLPGEEEEEFALIQPFNPAERPNLIGWLAGRSDGDNYGQLKAYVMPPDRTVFGPQQVQARIDQDDEVAEQITLWNQSGSRVIYGNLLVIPIEDSLLYAQPLFLRAEQSDIPELARVVLVFGDNVVMEDTLAQSLAALYGDAAPVVELPEDVVVEDGELPDEPVAGADDGEAFDGQAPVTGEMSPEVLSLINEALERYANAEAALAEGDLGAYREQHQEAEGLLREAQAIANGEPTAQAPADEDDAAGGGAADDAAAGDDAGEGADAQPAP